MSVLEELAAVVADLLREDSRRVLVGEDVRDGGMLGFSRAASEDAALSPRILGAPLTPAVTVAHAAGLACSGLRPILLLPSASALLEGLAGLREAASLGWRSGDTQSVPLLILAPSGAGFGLGGDAAESPEATLTQIPGLRTVIGARADELGALVKAAASFADGEDPTVVLLPRTLLLTQTESPVSDLGRPLSCSVRIQTGDAATVFAWGEAVDVALRAAHASGLSVTVVDVSSLAPLDTDALVEAARETGKLVIAHAGPRNYGVGAELAATFADQALLQLDAPVVRVCGHTGRHGPGSEHNAIPSVEDVTRAIEHVAHF
jgi:pyruvate/2-oxoglutarate/acetoin dehydrogenase E1 component